MHSPRPLSQRAQGAATYTTTDADDVACLTRIARGDRSAMKALHDAHADQLYRFVRTRLRDFFEAGDVVQDTFLEVWRAAGQFKGQSTVRTWMFRIARNKAIDRIRRSARVELREPDETIVDEAPRAEDIVAALSEGAQLRACIAKLPAVQRAAIRLAYYEGLPYPEIAEIEGVPLGTVKTRIRQAKITLAHCLAREGTTGYSG